MRFHVPELTGAPCSCPECVVAGVSHLPVVRTPDGELHGAKLARWYRERDKAVEAFKAFRLPKMPNGEPL